MVSFHTMYMHHYALNMHTCQAFYNRNTSIRAGKLLSYRFIGVLIVDHSFNPRARAGRGIYRQRSEGTNGSSPRAWGTYF